MRADQHVHPQDEFDTVAPSGPRGAHREPRSAWRRWWPFVAVLVLVPAMAYGLVTWLSDWDGLPGALDPGFSDSTDPTTEPTSAATTPGDEEEAEEPTSTPTQPPPEPDFGTPLEVFNATSTSGLAAGAAERLEGAGFTDLVTGNWQGADPEASVVLYPDEEALPTAQAAADALGIGSVEASADVDLIAVVLGADYQP